MVEGTSATALADLERVFADGFTRYQLAMAATQLGRAIAYRDTLTRRGRWLNIGAAVLGCAEAVRRRRSVRRGDTAPLAQMIPTDLSTVVGLAAVGPGPRGEVPRAVLWAHLQAQWAAAGVSVFARSNPERVRGLALAVLPYAVGPGRRTVAQLGTANRIGVGFVSFVSIAEVVARRLRSTAVQIDETVGQLVDERALLARRIEDERLRADVLERTAAEMEVIRDLVSVDRHAAARRAAAEESLLRGWVTGDAALFGAAPWVLPEESVAAGAAQRFDLAARRIEMFFRVAATGPLVVHAFTSKVRSTRWLAAAALTHAAVVCLELRRPAPRRVAVAVTDVAMVAIAVGAEANVLAHPDSGTAARTTPETLFGYAASIAPAAGTINAEPDAARAVTGALALVLGVSALSLRGSWSQRILLGSERIVMAAGGSWFSHWVRDVILRQTERLGEATEQLAAARAEAATAATRQRAQTLVHDSALQVLLWVQKDDLSAEQLRDWLDREIDRLRRPHERTDAVAARSLRAALGDLAAGFAKLGLRPSISVDDHADVLPPATTSALVEVVNEALTNVYKHSQDRSPTVQVDRSTDVELRVENRVASGVAARPGTGTSGMRSRVEELGGEFRAGPQGSRFVVSARVPAPG